MKFQTLSICVGSDACNAACPFCVAKQTTEALIPKDEGIDATRLKVACRVVDKGDTTTAVITGKGEPTLFRQQVTDAITIASKYLPLIELHTNGLLLCKPGWEEQLYKWQCLGLTTVALSVVHWLDSANKKIYTPDGDYPSLVKTIKTIKRAGLSVRLNCVGVKDYIDDPDTLLCLARFAFDYKVEQVTWRPVTPATHGKSEQREWAEKHGVTKDQHAYIEYWMQQNAILVPPRLADGAKVYHYPMGGRRGQNLCISTCLTKPRVATDEVRQLIYADGHLRLDWELEGAIVL